MAGPALSARRVCSSADSRKWRRRPGEFDDDGNPMIKRRKADDEHLIRKALLQSRLIDAVISLPAERLLWRRRSRLPAHPKEAAPGRAPRQSAADLRRAPLS